MAQSQASPTGPGLRPALERTIAVLGHGAIQVEPDTAHISMGVMSEAPTAREALAKSSAAMRAVIDALKAAGVAPKDIQTQSFNVHPRYGEPTRDNRSRAVSGYQVTNLVRVTVREIANLGSILDQAVSLGSNQIHGVAFEVSTADRQRDEARKAAVADAQRKAQLYAQAAGVGLGNVLAIEEHGAARFSRPMVAAGRMAASADAAPPVESGSVKVEASISVLFAIKE